VLTKYYKSFEVPFVQFASSLLFDLGRDSQKRFSCVRENLEVMSKLMTAVKDIRADVADMVKAPINPFGPDDPDTPIGPQFQKH